MYIALFTAETRISFLAIIDSSAINSAFRIKQPGENRISCQIDGDRLSHKIEIIKKKKNSIKNENLCLPNDGTQRTERVYWAKKQS